MSKIVVIDDDITQTVLVRTVLTKYGHQVSEYNDPKSFLSNFTPGDTDLILSDIHMPSMNGLDLVDAVKKIESSIPFIMFTSSNDIKDVISHFKKGVSDYLMKPLNPDDLIHRVTRVLDESKMVLTIKKIEQERELIELEKHKLSNWRDLYANKDAKQAEQMMQFFTRSINSGGGYVWLDILNGLPKEDDGSVILDRDLFQLVSESAMEQRKAFEYISYVNNLPEVELKEMTSGELVNNLQNFYIENLKEILEGSNRELSFSNSFKDSEYKLEIDFQVFSDIVYELTINAIKFSPDKSKLFVEIYKISRESQWMNNENSRDYVVFEIRNEPGLRNQLDSNKNPIIGIPYDYMELVFDLFYTIESYPIHHPNEKWSNGTGLYISRNMAKKMHCWLECKNILDYTSGVAKPFVQVRISVPVKK